MAKPPRPFPSKRRSWLRWDPLKQVWIPVTPVYQFRQVLFVILSIPMLLVGFIFYLIYLVLIGDKTLTEDDDNENEY